jgi:hypothetical protein
MQQTTHPTDDRLEAYCEGSLAASERAAIESHVFRCGRCRGEVEDWRALFTSLASLPHLAPSAGFADRVMAHVRIPEPWHSRASGLLGRVVPRSAPSWAFAVAMLAIPVLALGTLAVWLLSRSYLTAYRLWVFATDQFAHGANQAASGALTKVMQTDVMVWLVNEAGSFMGSAGMRGVGVLAAGGAAVILLCLWVLYRNVIRTPTRGTTYVSFMF